jgi:anti-sigma factor RsiW
MLRAPEPEIAPRRLDDAVGHYYGELSPAERSRFEKHLRECAACRRAVAAAGVQEVPAGGDGSAWSQRKY